MTRVLLLAVLLLLLAWGFWRMVDGVIEALGGTTKQRAKRQGGSAAVKLVRDPVCGTWVSPRTARSLKTGSATQYFCSDDCRVKFEART